MRTAIYARVSTKDQSCDLQLRDLRAYCVARKLTIAHEYVDIGQSGAKDSRPELNVLMADARKRKIDLIIAWRFDRFARSTKHLLLSLEEFRSLGIQFISYQENIDTSSPLGQALFTIISAVAQLEWDLIIDAQNLFCEISKYARVVHPDVAGTSGRTRIKQRFHANPEPLRYWFPPKWGLNNLVGSSGLAPTGAHVHGGKGSNQRA